MKKKRRKLLTEKKKEFTWENVSLKQSKSLFIFYLMCAHFLFIIPFDRMQEKEIKMLAEERRREKMEDKLARQKVRDEIERDKLARKEKFSAGAMENKPKPTVSNQNIPKTNYDSARLQVCFL